MVFDELRREREAKALAAERAKQAQEQQKKEARSELIAGKKRVHEQVLALYDKASDSLVTLLGDYSKAVSAPQARVQGRAEIYFPNHDYLTSNHYHSWHRQLSGVDRDGIEVGLDLTTKPKIDKAVRILQFGSPREIDRLALIKGKKWFGAHYGETYEIFFGGALFSVFRGYDSSGEDSYAVGIKISVSDEGVQVNDQKVRNEAELIERIKQLERAGNYVYI